ncbi:hypothetical protein ACA910_019766 [Epithemia clementina (nom. ined.)]
MNPFTHQRILHRLLAEVKEINTAMIQVGALALHVDQNLRNAVDNILIRIEKIRMELGKSTEALVNEDHQAPTVWGVLSALSASVAALEVLKASPPSDSYASQTALTTLEMKVDTLDAGMQDIKRGTRLFIERFQDSLFDSLQRLARKLKELDDQDVLHRLTRLDHQTKSSEHMETERCIDTAESDPLNLSDLLLESRLVGGLSSIDRTPQRQNHSSSGDTSQVAPMRRIPDALLELTERVRALESQGPSNGGGSSDGTSTTLSAFWTQKIADLEREVATLSTQATNGAIKFSGLGFTSVDEVQAWLNQALWLPCLWFGIRCLSLHGKLSLRRRMTGPDCNAHYHGETAQTQNQDSG